MAKSKKRVKFKIPRKRSRNYTKHFIFYSSFILISISLLFLIYYRTKKTKPNNKPQKNIIKTIHKHKKDSKATLNKTKETTSEKISFFISIDSFELSIEYIDSAPDEKTIFKLDEETSYQFKSLNLELIRQLGTIHKNVAFIFQHYNEQIAFFIPFIDKYFHHPITELHKYFWKYLIKFLKVTKITFDHLINLNRHKKSANLSDFQSQIFGLLIMENVLRKYYECKTGLERQTDKFMKLKMYEFRKTPGKYFRWLKGMVLYKKVVTMTFKHVNEIEENNKEREELFNNRLMSIGLNPRNLWTINQFKMIPYYILIESFHLIFYMFKFDNHGNIEGVYSWYSICLEENIENEKFVGKMKKIKHLTKDMLVYWINDNMEYNLIEMMKKYHKITTVASSLDDHMFNK